MNSTLESIAERWWSWVVPATWQLALLIGIVAAVVWVGRRASPRFRYALWLLVLVKVFLPPSLAIGWGIGSWGVQPVWNSVEPVAQQFLETQRALETTADVDLAVEDTAEKRAFLGRDKSRRLLLFAIWSVGCLMFLSVVLWHYRRLSLAVSRMSRVDEGPLSIRHEKIALQLGMKRVPEVYLSDEATSPFLFGVLLPRIVLPKQMANELKAADLDSVLLHELSHWQRRDPWIGWLQVLAQGLFWFHPLLWWATARLRHERECVCDEAVLRTGACKPVDYGEALLGVLSAARGQSRVQGSLVGVFEPGGNIQHRLEEIMNFEARKHQFGFLPRAVVLAMAVLFLPMAIPVLSAEGEIAAEPRRNPWVEKTVPAVGATDVDPKLNEISITFDRDMGGGMSWTGNEKSFLPPIPSDAEPYWRDSRTCVLPVKLSAGQYYRAGINSTSFHNFKSSAGEPAPCSVFCFVTKGATPAMKSRVRVPQIVKMTPANGAEDVKPSAQALRVTFDMPMGKGMSWTGGGENFPKVSAGRSARWTGGGKTCVLSVALKPSWHYILGINSRSHINFQSKWGVPVVPIEYRFRTSGGQEPAAERTNQDVDPTTARVRGLVEDFFQSNFRDVKQRKTIEWGPVTKDKKGNVSIRYKYYAKIWDKDAMTMNQVFTFDSSGEPAGWSNVEGFPLKHKKGEKK